MLLWRRCYDSADVCSEINDFSSLCWTEKLQCNKSVCVWSSQLSSGVMPSERVERVVIITSGVEPHPEKPSQTLHNGKSSNHNQCQQHCPSKWNVGDCKRQYRNSHSRKRVGLVCYSFRIWTCTAGKLIFYNLPYAIEIQLPHIRSVIFRGILTILPPKLSHIVLPLEPLQGPFQVYTTSHYEIRILRTF